MGSKNRVVIVSDEYGKWYVRRIRIVEHDLEKDEKVYRCDWPIGTTYDEPEAALSVAKEFLGLPVDHSSTKDRV